MQDFELEIEYSNQGKVAVAGVDEAGRGPLAGPVVAAAVILDHQDIPPGLNDSKKLSEAVREHLFEQIIATATVGFAQICVAQIDAINIRQASLMAMRKALVALPARPDFALVDGRDIPENLLCSARAVIGGDRTSLSIAAASIVAKVLRDRSMLILDKAYPIYGFARHKGYGTAFHREMIAKHGFCPVHRKSFAPIKQMATGL